MTSYLMGVASGIVLIAIVVGGIFFFRKDLPYEFEIVPIEKGIGITNTTTWNQRDLVVSFGERGKGSLADKLMKGSVNQLIIEAPARNEPYSIRIRRADVIGRVLYRSFETQLIVSEPAPKYAVLVGASVGRHWELPAFPDRTGSGGFVFGYRGKYGYDKGERIEQLSSATLKPDIVIIKECAAYFPRDAERIVEKIPEWVETLESAGIRPALATCAPVTKENDEENPGRQEAIDRANRFIRAYCSDNNIGLVDLAGALRASVADTHMREDFAQSDGLHLTPEAYKKLDTILIPSLTLIGGE